MILKDEATVMEGTEDTEQIEETKKNHAEEEIKLSIPEKKIKIKESLRAFLEAHTIYDVLPINAQVLVFNMELQLFETINALAENKIFCGVMWDEEKKAFIDIFTVRDIMEILITTTEFLESRYPGKAHTLPAEDEKSVIECIRQFQEYKEMPGDPMEISIAEESKSSEATSKGYPILISMLKLTKLSDWAQISNKFTGFKTNILVKKTLKDSLLDACLEMSKNGIHRLAIIEEKAKTVSLCGMITYDMIISYIISNLQGNPSLFEVPLSEIKIGTVSPFCLKQNCTLYKVLKSMKDKRISFVPIISDVADEKGNFPTVGFFSLKDLIFLIRNNRYHLLNIPIKDILREVKEDKTGLEEADLEGIEETEEISPDFRLMSISGEHIDLPEEGKSDIIYGKDRLSIITEEDTLKSAIEKIVISQDKRLIKFNNDTKQVINVISITDIFNYITQ